MTTSDVEERFRRLARHPELEEWLATPPGEEGARRVDPGCLLGFAVTALVLALFATLVSALFFPPLAFVPLALLAVGLLSLLRRRRLAPWEEQPLESGLAYVESTRTSLTEGRASASDSRLKAALLFADGSRRDVDVVEGAEEVTAAGALGVAYLRGLWLVGFRRLDGVDDPAGEPAPRPDPAR